MLPEDCHGGHFLFLLFLICYINQENSSLWPTLTVHSFGAVIIQLLLVLQIALQHICACCFLIWSLFEEETQIRLPLRRLTLI